MKTLILFFILTFIHTSVFCQFERPPINYKKLKLLEENQIDSLVYIWYETDSVPEWNSLYNNAYSKVTSGWRIIIQDSFLYRINPKTEYFKNQFIEGHLLNGIHIVKRNLYTGKFIWQNDYNDVSAGRQEFLMRTRLNQNGNIEIIGYRRARTTESNNIQFGAFGINDRDLRLFFREYDANTGQLLKHYFPDSLDFNAAVLKETTPNNNTRLFFTPNDTAIRYFEAIVEPGPQGILTFLLDRRGHRISDIDTVITNEPQNDPNVFLTKENTYLIVEDFFADNKIILHFFDVNMNKIETKILPDVFQKGKLSTSPIKESNYFELFLRYNNNPPDNHFETYVMFVDLEGNLVDTIRRKGLFGSFIYNENKNLFQEEAVFDVSSQTWTNNFWYKPYQMEYTKLKSYSTGNNFYPFIGHLFILDSLVLITMLEQNREYDQYKASSMMLVKLKDLGLTLSSNNEITYAVHWTIYPNPCTDYLQISFSDQQSGQIKVFDVTGRMVSAVEKQSDATYVSLESQFWQPGLYFVQFISDKGAFATKKVVKN